MIFPDVRIIANYVFNVIIVVLIYFLIFRPLIKSVKLTLKKISGEKPQEISDVQNKRHVSKNNSEKEKLEKIKKQNEEILKKAEKEIEEMENNALASMFENKE